MQATACHSSTSLPTQMPCKKVQLPRPSTASWCSNKTDTWSIIWSTWQKARPRSQVPTWEASRPWEIYQALERKPVVRQNSLGSILQIRLLTQRSTLRNTWASRTATRYSTIQSLASRARTHKSKIKSKSSKAKDWMTSTHWWSSNSCKSCKNLSPSSTRKTSFSMFSKRKTCTNFRVRSCR